MLSALILAGGLGSRMGTDKGLAQLGGAPLVRHIGDVLSGVADEVVVSVAHGKAGLYSEILGDLFRYVEDKDEGVGPLEGLVQGLRFARGDYVIVSPCDTPFLRKAVCESVIRSAMGRDGSVPMTGRTYLEPLHAAYRRGRCAEVFGTALSKGGRAPQEAFRGLDLVFLREEEVRGLDPDLLSFWNINSPEDLRKAESQLARLR